MNAQVQSKSSKMASKAVGISILSLLVAVVSAYVAFESIGLAKRARQAELYAEARVVEVYDEGVVWDLSVTNFSETPAYYIYLYLIADDGENSSNSLIGYIEMIPPGESRTIRLTDVSFAKLFSSSSTFRKHLFVGYDANNRKQYSQRIPLVIDSRITWNADQFELFNERGFDSDRKFVEALIYEFPYLAPQDD